MTICLSIGVWHDSLCGVLAQGDVVRDRTEQAARLTFDRPRVTCTACLVALDRLEELGWPVKARWYWWQGYARKSDGRWRERLWQYGCAPSPRLRQQAMRREHRIERVQVLDVRSLRHWAAALRGEK